ncbi:Y-family DNA polymerase [Porphyromonas levii]|uniref:Y-family DNA polymerase n=1 Tax=Porphyromonas levii TaxID=28114 RepID=UPI001F0DEC61|nr:hypothetical protein [Porphyromonas levii]
MAKDIRRKILKGVGISTCIGVSKTKTLAKLANRVAKKNEQLEGEGEREGAHLVHALH